MRFRRRQPAARPDPGPVAGQVGRSLVIRYALTHVPVRRTYLADWTGATAEHWTEVIRQGVDRDTYERIVGPPVGQVGRSLAIRYSLTDQFPHDHADRILHDAYKRRERAERDAAQPAEPDDTHEPVTGWLADAGVAV